jgi:hypothetical protein
METCTIASRMEIVEGGKSDYELLSQYHYREGNLGPYAAIFAMRGPTSLGELPTSSRYTTSGLRRTGHRAGKTAAGAAGAATVGVIVYTMPSAAIELRNVAMGGLLDGLDRQTRLAFVNRNIRCISRVIIEPRFRSLGLAVRIVKETMPLMDVPIIEALAVMGQVNPFFEKAGMTKYEGATPVRCVRLIEALGAVGVEEDELIDPQLVQRKFDLMLDTRCSMLDFIEREIIIFLQGYGKRRYMQAGIERTRYVLSKLTDRPAYYFWRNPNEELRI